MKVIQVRNVPDEVHRELRKRAAERGVSLSDYALGELERIASQPTVGEVLRRAEARSGGADLATAVAIIREGRENE
jgi:antitoxin FitA